MMLLESDTRCWRLRFPRGGTARQSETWEHRSPESPNERMGSDGPRLGVSQLSSRSDRGRLGLPSLGSLAKRPNRIFPRPVPLKCGWTVFALRKAAAFCRAGELS